MISYAEFSDEDVVLEAELVEEGLNLDAGRELSSAYLDMLESEPS